MIGDEDAGDEFVSRYGWGIMSRMPLKQFQIRISPPGIKKFIRIESPVLVDVVYWTYSHSVVRIPGIIGNILHSHLGI